MTNFIIYFNGKFPSLNTMELETIVMTNYISIFFSTIIVFISEVAFYYTDNYMIQHQSIRRYITFISLVIISTPNFRSYYDDVHCDYYLIAYLFIITIIQHLIVNSSSVPISNILIVFFFLRMTRTSILKFPYH